MPGIEHYRVPTSLEEATDILQAGKVTILAGGTDLMPQRQAGRLEFEPVLMNLRRVPELAGIAEDAGVLRLGARVTITELLRSTLVRERLNLLWQACDHFASDQIRNAATLGGNLCNASPAGDTLVPLLALDACVVLAAKPNGTLQTRRVPLGEFLLGPGRTCRAGGELLVAVEVPAPAAGFIGAFYKHGTRPGLDISTISIAAGARQEGNVLRDVRIAFGAVAATAVRAPQSEAALEGRAPDAQALEAAAQQALGEIRPISDLRASEWYRRELIHNMLIRVLNHVCQR
ncbi:MAG: xanthine dehydrogenase family protein subunit M [Ideonella sp.]|nr:xanthine dehydrogenase family protein subunit M [Ideonella sp.]